MSSKYRLKDVESFLPEYEQLWTNWSFHFEDGWCRMRSQGPAVGGLPRQGLERPRSRARRKGCCGRCMQINSESLSWQQIPSTNLTVCYGNDASIDDLPVRTMVIFNSKWFNYPRDISSWCRWLWLLHRPLQLHVNEFSESMCDPCHSWCSCRDSMIPSNQSITMVVYCSSLPII